MPVEGRTPLINIAIASGGYAVLSFFTLSGFLIALSVERNIEGYGYFNIREFVIARVARIYPALIASVILCISLYWTLHFFGISGELSLSRPSDVYPPSRTEFKLTLVEIIYTLMQTYAFGPGWYISANGPLWSLSYEVGFYILTGLFATLIRGRDARLFSALSIFCIAIVVFYMKKYLFLHYGTIWLLGVCLFINLKNNPNFEDIAKSENKIPLINLSSSIIALFIFLCLTNLMLALCIGDGGIIYNWIASVVSIMFLFGAIRLNRSIFPYFVGFANSTYTLYLFHFPLMLFFYALIRDIHEVSPSSYYMIAFIITISIVIVSHYLAKTLENQKLWKLFLKKFAILRTSCS